MLTWHRQHHDGAYDGEDGDTCHGEAFALESCGAPAGSEDDSDLDGAEGYVEENGLEIRVPEVFDDEVAESADAAACDATSKLC